MTRPGRLVALATVSATVALVCCTGSAADQPTSGNAPCAVSQDVFSDQLLATADEGASDRRDVERASLRLPDGGRALAFDLGQRRGERTRTVTFELARDPDRLLTGGQDIQMEPLTITKDQNTTVFPGLARVIAASVSADGQAIEITVCVDPRTSGPGEWTGTLVTDDWRLDRTSLPVVITLKSDRADWLPWVVAVPVALAVLAVQWALALVDSKKRIENVGSTDHTKATIGVIALVVLVALLAVIYPHVRTVHDHPSWAGTDDEVLALGWDVGRTAMTAYPALAALTIAVVVAIAALRRLIPRSGNEPEVVDVTAAERAGPPDDPERGQRADMGVST